MFPANPDHNPSLASTPLLMSGAAVPHVDPTQSGKPAGGPQIVAAPEPPRRRSFAWIAVVLLAAAAGAGYWTWKQRQEQNAAAAAVVVRSVSAAQGKLQKTLRVTGSTGAEDYVSLIAPSMRGGRGGMVSVQMMGGGRGGGGMVISVSGSSSGSDRSSGSGSTSTVTGTSSLASTSMSGNTVQSTSGAASAAGGGSAVGGGGDTVTSSAGSSSSNLRAGGGRASASRASSSARSSSSRTTSASTSATLGADGLGSTSGQMPGNNNPSGGGGGGGGGGAGGGGRGGGGMSDFMMQLQMLAPNGIRVKKGDVVAEFDRQYMLLRLDDYKANVEQSESALKANYANVEVTRKSYDQQIKAAKALVEKSELDMKTIPVRGAIDSERLKLALEEARANLKQLQEAAKYVDIGEQATMKVAELALETAKVELRRAQANADRMILKAPMDGLVVVQNNFRGGEMTLIQQGDQVFPGMMFMRIVEPNSMVINANVSQVDVQNMRLGQKATVRFDAFPGLELPAHVMMIGAITKTGGMRASYKKDVPVRLKLDRIDPRVIPDLSVSADIVLGETEEKATVVPLEAVMSEGSGESAKTFALVRSAAGTWERREIEVELTSYTRAAIRKGLQPGDIVALETPPANKPDAPPDSTS